MKKITKKECEKLIELFEYTQYEISIIKKIRKKIEQGKPVNFSEGMCVILLQINLYTLRKKQLFFHFWKKKKPLFSLKWLSKSKNTINIIKKEINNG